MPSHCEIKCPLEVEVSKWSLQAVCQLSGFSAALTTGADPLWCGTLANTTVPCFGFRQSFAMVKALRSLGYIYTTNDTMWEEEPSPKHVKEVNSGLCADFTRFSDPKCPQISNCLVQRLKKGGTQLYVDTWIRVSSVPSTPVIWISLRFRIAFPPVNRENCKLNGQNLPILCQVNS